MQFKLVVIKNGNQSKWVMMINASPIKIYHCQFGLITVVDYNPFELYLTNLPNFLNDLTHHLGKPKYLCNILSMDALYTSLTRE